MTNTQLLAALVIAASPTALVADQPFDWSGTYGGFNLDLADPILSGIQDCCADDPGDDPGNLDPSAVALGGHFGFNIVQNQWVYGVEGAFFYGGLVDSQLSQSEPIANESDIDINGIGSLRGRIGRIAGDAMVFGILGASYADATYTMRDPDAANSKGSADLSGWGYMIGAGIDLPLTENTSARVSYERHIFDTRVATDDLTTDSNEEDFVKLENVDVLHFGISMHF
ncbi:outer membrane protein [Roseobacter sp. CCS2]|uniref:outer membrane protein n=1 Tax=Roseobacter sp. CCS2 TaxID=391593 RepID=UPI0018DEA358|nr:outer membrane beta-barrel protein [Roseobacter sp. CCS2]